MTMASLVMVIRVMTRDMEGKGYHLFVLFISTLIGTIGGMFVAILCCIYCEFSNEFCFLCFCSVFIVLLPCAWMGLA